MDERFGRGKEPPPCEKVHFYGVNETFLAIFGPPDGGTWPLFWRAKRTNPLSQNFVLDIKISSWTSKFRPGHQISSWTSKFRPGHQNFVLNIKIYDIIFFSPLCHRPRRAKRVNLATQLNPIPTGAPKVPPPCPTPKSVQKTYKLL